jgi:hypothetical protein
MKETRSFVWTLNNYPEGGLTERWLHMPAQKVRTEKVMHSDTLKYEMSSSMWLIMAAACSHPGRGVLASEMRFGRRNQIPNYTCIPTTVYLGSSLSRRLLAFPQTEVIQYVVRRC